MDKAAQEKVLRAYEHALSLSEEEREEFLDREFEGDEELQEVTYALIKSKLGSKWKRKKKERSEDEPSVASPKKDQDTVSFSEFYGDSLPEHYRFIQRLGKGGMGEVVLAEDVRLNRKVAIKFLSQEVTSDRERLKRFRYEAQAASALNHPNIVTVHDIGEGNGFNYIVCEYVSGETLSSRIARGRLPVPEAVDIAIEICSALAAAHRSGIIHRDIKPENVILRPDGGLKVLDFGLAKSISGAHEVAIDDEANTYEKVSTIPGMVMGTPQYMSPEQARGRDLDERSDLFSLGVILYEMVTGKAPFRGKTPVDVILAVTGKEPPKLEERITDPPEGLVRVIKHALQKHRRDRYESAEEMLADLRTLSKELDTFADGMAPTGIMDPKTTARNTVSSIFRKRLVWEVPAIILVAAVVALAVYYFALPSGPASPGGGSLRSVNITKWNAGPGELISAASLSPDGNRIAFGSAGGSKSTKIWFQPTSAGEPVEVTKEDFYSQYPVWSPDGEEIAFFSNRTGKPGFWKVPYTGGKPAPLVSDVDAAAALKYWAPSGKIYFQAKGDLFSADIQSGKVKPVTSFGKQGLNPRAIEISRDESKIAYSVLEGETWKLKAGPVSGEPVVVATSPQPIQQLAWGPNGNFVYFSEQVSGVYQVFRGSLGGGEPLQISNGLQDSLVEDVSADGKRILYSSIEESSDLWLVDTGSDNEELLADDVSSEYWAEVSPDGNAVAYQSVEKAGRPYEGTVEIRPMDKSQSALTLSQNGFAPVFSHDGSWVAYFVSKNGRPEIWKVGATGGNAAKLADGDLKTPDFMMTPYLKVGTNQISWSPSDDLVAYSKRENGVSDIYAVPAKGGSARKLTNNPDKNDIYCCSGWSPSGDRIFFASQMLPGSKTGRGTRAVWTADTDTGQQKMLFDTNDRLLLLGLDGSGRLLIATAPPDTGQPVIPAKVRLSTVDPESGKVSGAGELDNPYFYNIHLSPDGRALAYVVQSAGASVIKLRSLDSGVERILLTEKDPKVLISSLEWSPDGKKIVFGRQSRSNLLSMFVE